MLYNYILYNYIIYNNFLIYTYIDIHTDISSTKANTELLFFFFSQEVSLCFSGCQLTYFLIEETQGCG